LHCSISHQSDAIILQQQQRVDVDVLWYVMPQMPFTPVWLTSSGR